MMLLFRALAHLLQCMDWLFYGSLKSWVYGRLMTLSLLDGHGINSVHAILSQNGIGLPVTAFAHSTKYTDDMINMVGGAPVIIKLLEGTQGLGVVLGETLPSARSVIEAFREVNVNILVQEYIKEANAMDIRCLVINGEVVASMKRTSPAGDFRSNLHRGGTAIIEDITSEERSIAVRSAMLLGLNVCGVDMLRSNRGPVVMEVNSSPGLEGIEKATKIDVAGKIIEYVEKNAQVK